MSASYEQRYSALRSTFGGSSGRGGRAGADLQRVGVAVVHALDELLLRRRAQDVHQVRHLLRGAARTCGHARGSTHM